MTKPKHESIPMSLVQYKNTKVLCGFTPDQSSIYVLRKVNEKVFHLNIVPVSKVDEQLRSFVSAEQGAENEIQHAITETERDK